MLKKLLVSLLLLVGLLGFPLTTVSAQQSQTKKDIVIVNPIRGGDFWDHKFSILDTPQNQYKMISQDNLPATWLPRYDALKNTEVIEFLKSLNSMQEVGLFMEITPSLTKAAGVKYNQSPSWHYAKSVLLTGYSPSDRKKLIDTSFEEYKNTFGKYPKSVGAWWIDAGSLVYMREKYQIETNLDVSDQFSTDQYQVWGQYWSTPFYPAKTDALMPAQSPPQKIGIVTIQWANRDPFNGYGNGVFESTYSVQGNDYLLHNLGTDYFGKLIDIYPQTTVGLENDFSWQKFGPEFTNELNLIVQKRQQNQVQVSTMANFAAAYQKAYPEISPSVVITADDPLGTGGKVVWVNTPKSRVGFFYGPYGTMIRDLRVFNDSSEENCLKVACDKLLLAFKPDAAIDDVNFGINWPLDEGKISDFKVTQQGSDVLISYKNQAGNIRKIKIMPNDIEVDGRVYTIPQAILNAVNPVNENGQKIIFETTPKLDLAQTTLTLGIGTLKFVLFVILFLFLPGWILRKKWLEAIPLGLAAFALVSFLVGYLNQPLLLWLLPAVCLVLLKKRGLPKLSIPKLSRFEISALVIGIIGTICWVLTTVKSGLLYNYGYGFWGPNGHDGIWHLSLIAQLQKHLPPQNPIFAGGALSNYHYLYDLVLANAGTLLGINTSDLLFRFFPILLAILTGFLTYKLVKNMGEYLGGNYGKLAAVFGVFFVYFGGSFGWVVSYIRDHNFGGESMFWAQQSISTQLNPPFAASIVLLFTAVILANELFSHKSKEAASLHSFLALPSLCLALLGGVLIGFKVYAGILFIGALGLYALEKLIFKKDIKPAVCAGLTILLSLAIFLPNNSGSGSLIIFSPFWLVQSMVESPDRLGWIRLYLTMSSGVAYKVIPAFIFAILIFLVGNLGLRVIGFAQIKSLFRDRILFWIALFGFLIPLFLIQKGTSWNTIQFLYYTLFVFSLFAGVSLAWIVKKLPMKLGWIFAGLVIALTVPTTYGILTQYTPNLPATYLSNAQIEALNNLSNQPDGTVLSFTNSERQRNRYIAPYPLDVYAPTAYVSAFSGQPSYVADSINLDILGIDYNGRLNTLKDFRLSNANARKLIDDGQIRYIYLLKNQNISLDPDLLGVKKVFENSEAIVYRAY